MKHTIRIVLALAALVSLAGPASAQTFQPRQPRPDWGIFASGVSATEQRLVMTVNFGAGYEDDLSKPAIDPVTLEPAVSPFYSGPFGNFGAALRYNVGKKAVSGSAGVSATGRNYFNQTTQPLVGVYSADTTLGFAVGKTARLSTSAHVGRYLRNLLPTGYNADTGWSVPGVPQAPDLPSAFTTGVTYQGYGASAQYSQSFTKSFGGYAGWSYYANDAWSSDPAKNRYDSQWLNAGLRYAVARGIGIHLGYGTNTGGFSAASTDPNYRARSIDAGLDLDRALSLTRRSTLTFGTGVSGFVNQQNRARYHAVGHLNFAYEIGRSWGLHASLNRNAEFNQTIGQPTFNDAVSFGLSGLIGRRLEVQAGLGAIRGRAVADRQQLFDAGGASAGVRIAVNRVLAVSVNYGYYRYGFSNALPVLPPGYVRQTDRQTVQLGLVVWAPLVTQARRGNAAR